MRDPEGLVAILSVVVALVVLFAQVKLFAIASTLTEILKELRQARLQLGSSDPRRPS
jgi:Sec-independent protein translocase protein TatA